MIQPKKRLVDYLRRLAPEFYVRMKMLELEKGQKFKSLVKNSAIKFPKEAEMSAEKCCA